MRIIYQAHDVSCVPVSSVQASSCGRTRDRQYSTGTTFAIGCTHTPHVLLYTFCGWIHSFNCAVRNHGSLRMVQATIASFLVRCPKKASDSHLIPDIDANRSNKGSMGRTWRNCVSHSREGGTASFFSWQPLFPTTTRPPRRRVRMEGRSIVASAVHYSTYVSIVQLPQIQESNSFLCYKNGVELSAQY